MAPVIKERQPHDAHGHAYGQSSTTNPDANASWVYGDDELDADEADPNFVSPYMPLSYYVSQGRFDPDALNAQFPGYDSHPYFPSHPQSAATMASALGRHVLAEEAMRRRRQATGRQGAGGQNCLVQ